MTVFDVVVVGAGAGGLCAAARLAKSGLRVLVVERLPFVGGRFSSLLHDGFHITTGAVSIECGSALEQTFRDVGAEFDVRRPRPRVKYRIEGMAHELPEHGGLKYLMSLVARDGDEAERVLRAFREAAMNPPTDATISIRDWLRHVSDTTGVLDVVQTLCGGTFSVNANEAPAVEFFNLLRGGGFSNFGFASRGNAALANSLAAVIPRNGGEIRLRTAASQILVHNGTVQGVVVKGGDAEEKIRSRFVISNIGPQATVALAGAENFDSAYLQRSVAGMQASYTLLLEIPSDQPLTNFPGVLMTVGSRRTAFIVTQTICCPELSTNGRHLTTVLGTPEKSQPGIDLKRQFELMTEDAQEILPDFDRWAGGVMMRSFHGDWPGYRARPGCDAPQQTSVSGLYNVGDGAKASGFYGLGGSAEGARLVAEEIRQLHEKSGSPAFLDRHLR